MIGPLGSQIHAGTSTETQLFKVMQTDGHSPASRFAPFYRARPLTYMKRAG